MRWLRLFGFLVREQYAQISVLHGIFECCDGWGVGTPKRQCAVMAWRPKIAGAVARGTKQGTGAFCFSQKTGFCFVGGFDTTIYGFKFLYPWSALGVHHSMDIYRVLFKCVVYAVGKAFCKYDLYFTVAFLEVFGALRYPLQFIVQPIEEFEGQPFFFFFVPFKDLGYIKFRP